MPLKNQIVQIVKRRMGEHSLNKDEWKDTLCIFSYHDVSDDPSPFMRQYHLNVPPKLFARQLAVIKNYFYMINPQQLISGSYQTPAALITFDDGTSGYFREAVPMMERMKIPSINFLNMEPLEGGVFWAGLLCYLTTYDGEFQRAMEHRHHRLSKSPPHQVCHPNMVSDYLKRIDFNRLKDKVARFSGSFATLGDLTEAQDNPYVYLGNHLYNHYNASMLDEKEFSRQYHLNQERISEFRNGRPCFAFPYGSHTKKHLKWLESFGCEAIFCSGNKVNNDRQGKTFNRIFMNATVETIEDLFGRIEFFKVRKMLGMG